MRPRNTAVYPTIKSEKMLSVALCHFCTLLLAGRLITVVGVTRWQECFSTPSFELSYNNLLLPLCRGASIRQTITVLSFVLPVLRTRLRTQWQARCRAAHNWFGMYLGRKKDRTTQGRRTKALAHLSNEEFMPNCAVHSKC